VVPSRCARCGRGAESFAIERVHGAEIGTAGCPCGDTFEIALEGTEPVAPLSVAPRRPEGWTEAPRIDGWTASLRPPRTRLVGLSVIVVFILAHGAIGARSGIDMAIRVAGTVVFALVASFLALRRWRYALDATAFRADALGVHVVIPTDQILRFSARSRPGNRGRGERHGSYELVVHLVDQAPRCLPLAVVGEDQAQFVADRANAVLAAGGRVVEHDYRGARIRVAMEEDDDDARESESESEARVTSRRM
jgi:hypothetical protein